MSESKTRPSNNDLFDVTVHATESLEQVRRLLSTLNETIVDDDENDEIAAHWVNVQRDILDTICSHLTDIEESVTDLQVYFDV